MSYEVIARKWRPQSFDELIGQNHVGLTLHNALKSGRLHHAILLTGPRGTGKTSSARILAKSLKCTQAIDFTPCQTCLDCVTIQQGRNVDVLEIDGASNNGVDAIRQLRENVQYMASSGQYKIYIIDEVHMLSTSAFNALLKTLEEPPPHVVFIMATTEAHKIPLTILSRCQRFDFRRISTRQIADHLGKICLHDKIEASEDALWLLAKQADGSMRDAQSLLDQTITFLNGSLTYETVVQALGLTDRTLVWDTLWAFLNRNPSQILPILKKIHLSGTDPKLFFEEICELLRMALLIQVNPQDNLEWLDISDSDLKGLEQVTKMTEPSSLHLLFDMAQKSLQDILSSFEPRLVFDICLLRMAQAPHWQDIQSLEISNSKVFSSLQEKVKLPPNAPSHRINPSTSPTPPSGPMSPDRWLQFIEKLRSVDPIFAAKIEPLIMKPIDGNTLELMIPKQYQFLKVQFQNSDVTDKLKKWVSQIWKKDFEFIISDVQNLDSQAPKGFSAMEHAQNKQQAAEDELLQQMLANPKVKAASSVFKGKVKLLKSQDQKGDKR